MWVGVEFLGISLAAQDEIVKWTSELLRKLVVERRRLEEGACVRCGAILKHDKEASGAMCKACAEAAKEDTSSDWYKAYLKPYAASVFSSERRNESGSLPPFSHLNFPSDHPPYSVRPSSSIYPSASLKRLPPSAPPVRLRASPSTAPSSHVATDSQKSATRH
jgi:hypothetical protein